MVQQMLQFIIILLMMILAEEECIKALETISKIHSIKNYMKDK